MINLKIITNIKQFEELNCSWNVLLSKLSPNVSVFYNNKWYRVWWSHFSSNAALNIFSMWDEDCLVGVAPLIKKKIKLHGLPVEAFGFIENRNSLHNDFFVLEDYRELFFAELLKYFFATSPQWNIVLLKNLPTSSPNYDLLLRSLDKTNTKWSIEPSFNSPYLLPSGSWVDYLATRSTRTRKSLRNIQNSMNKAGDVLVKNVRSWNEYLSIRDDLFHVAQKSWTERIGDSLATPQNKAFFNDLAFCAAENGWLSIWCLYLNGQMIAFEFHLKGYGNDHAMRGSYLPAFANLSPGTYLEMQILKDAFDGEEPVQKYDFGGSFDNYKRKWTDDATPHHEILIYNNNRYSRLAAFHEMRTVPFLRCIRDKIQQVKA